MNLSTSRVAAFRDFFVVAVVLLVTAGPMAYGNWVAKKGGLLDDPILNREDPWRLMDEEARRIGGDLRTGDTVGFLLRFPTGMQKGDLARVLSLTERVKAAFPEYGVLSLSTAAAYRDTGTELENRPYVDAETVRQSAEPGWSLGDWQRRVARDPAVYGVLVGRAFDYAVVTLFLPSGYDDTAVFRRVVEFVEGRRLPWWEWLVKTDVSPSPEFGGVTPSGWVVARGLMDAAMTADVFKLCSVGLCVVGVAFFLSFGCLRQALLSTLVVLIAFVWVRGSLGLLQLAGVELYERVYFLLVYSAVIVSGISFTERKFTAYNEIREAEPALGAREAWRRTRGTDGLIWLTSTISVLNFATLGQIGIKGIAEMGLFSALGMVYLVLLVLWFLPALHSLAGGTRAQSPAGWPGLLSRCWNRAIEGLVRGAYRLVDPEPGGPYRPGRRAAAYLALTLGLVGGAAALIASDYLPVPGKRFQFLEVKTRPLEYIRGTAVHRAGLYLNEPGRYGFDRLSVLVAPKAGEVADPDFFARAAGFKERALALPHVREVNSVADSVQTLCRESYGAPLPATAQEAHDALQTLEWDLDPRLRAQLWSRSAVAFFVSTEMEDSNHLGEICRGLVDLGRREFPGLTVLPFGKLAVYPQTDRYIREGKPWNALSSQVIVAGVCALWVTLRGRRRSGPRMIGWRTGLVMSAPFVFGSGAIALVMMLLRVPLDQATACITALTINAAVDFGLYLTADYQSGLLEGRGLRGALRRCLLERGHVVVVDAVLNALCFGPLLWSHFVPVARMGWIMTVMLAACAFGALVIMPSLFPWCVRDALPEARSSP